MEGSQKKNTVSLLGSLSKQLQCIREEAIYLKKNGYEILAPKLSNIKTGENGFVIFEGDISDNPVIIESDFLEKCLKSERIVVCNKEGYVGNTVMFEIGYLLAKKKNIEFIEVPRQDFLLGVVDYFSDVDNKKIFTYHK